MTKSVDEVLAELDACVERMRDANARSLAGAEKFARTARAARPSRSNPHMAAVPLTDDASEASDLTGAFNALRRSI